MISLFKRIMIIFIVIIVIVDPIEALAVSMHPDSVPIVALIIIMSTIVFGIHLRYCLKRYKIK